MSSRNDDINDDSTILYTNFMLMYYHTSRIVLCHHEVLHLDTLQNDSLATTAKDQCIILENQHELQDAAFNITKCHRDLVRRKLVRWLYSPTASFQHNGYQSRWQLSNKKKLLNKYPVKETMHLSGKSILIPCYSLIYRPRHSPGHVSRARNSK